MKGEDCINREEGKELLGEDTRTFENLGFTFHGTISTVMISLQQNCERRDTSFDILAFVFCDFSAGVIINLLSMSLLLALNIFLHFEMGK